MSEHMCFVRISDGVRKIYSEKEYLHLKGFAYNKRSYGKSFFEKVMPEAETEEYVSWCRTKQLRIDVIPEEYTRSSDYRKTFFSNNCPAVPAYYRCAYCGKKIQFKDTTVDHIFPVNQLSYSIGVRNWAKRFGIHGANEEKNLVAACRTCNSKKGTKMGMWIVRGFLGKNEHLWKIRKGIKWSVIIGGVTCAVFLFTYETGIMTRSISTLLTLLR